MRKAIVGSFIVASLALIVVFSLARPAVTHAEQTQQTEQMQKQQTADIEKMIADWPEASKKAAKNMLEQYGPPAGTTPSKLIWEDEGPWVEIIVFKKPHPHDWPMPHEDVLFQTIEYQVPVEKVGELAQFDKAVVPMLTRGTLSAMCDFQGANYLALNLAHRLITGETTVAQARSLYEQAVKEFKAGNPPVAMQKLMFDPPKGPAYGTMQ
jgi:hypothetical protein